ncbi:M15 family metallopeptidase [Streptomyces sp. NPDC048057]|uniref:M15 family metallopeptidase n=1 Tax=Streptomyces sp. NPDC048057 TaxID=3155628 RepID=UPI0033C23A4B
MGLLVHWWHNDRERRRRAIAMGGKYPKQMTEPQQADSVQHTDQGARPGRTTGGRRGRRALVSGAIASLVLLGMAWWAVVSTDGGRLGVGSSGASATGRSASEGKGADGRSGAIGSGRQVTPFDTDHPAVTRLDPALLTALRAAATAAKEDGVDLFVTSGWRSKEYQRELLQRGIARHGSLEKARKFVSTPDKSAHVTGKAVDIGPTDADDWLIRKGAAFGLCQKYANEMWHFELLTEPGGTCPAPLPDAAG